MKEKTGFWTTFKTATIEFGQYSSFLTRSFWSSINYLYFLLVLLAFIIVIKTAFPLLPQIGKIDKIVGQVKDFATDAYPPELVVDVKNGQVSTNVPEPYYIDLPKQITGQIQPEKFHLLAIDTKAKIEDFPKYNTGALVTKNALVYYDDNKSLKVYFLDRNYNFHLDKKQYDTLVSKFLPYMDYSKPIIIGLGVFLFFFGPFFIAGSELIGKLIGHLLWAILFFIIAKILSKNLGYKQIYKLTFFGVSLPQVISTIQSLIPSVGSPVIGQGQSMVWLISLYNNLPGVIFFLIMIAVLVAFEKTPPHPQISPAPTTNPPSPMPPTPPTTNPPSTQIAQTTSYKAEELH